MLEQLLDPALVDERHLDRRGEGPVDEPVELRLRLEREPGLLMPSWMCLHRGFGK